MGISQSTAGAMAGITVKRGPAPDRLAGTVTVGGRTGVGAIDIGPGLVKDHVDAAVNVLRRGCAVDAGAGRGGVSVTLFTSDQARLDVCDVAVGAVIGRAAVGVCWMRLADAVTVTVEAIESVGREVRIILHQVSAEITVAVADVGCAAGYIDTTVDVQAVVGDRGVVRNRRRVTVSTAEGLTDGLHRRAVEVGGVGTGEGAACSRVIMTRCTGADGCAPGRVVVAQCRLTIRMAVDAGAAGVSIARYGRTAVAGARTPTIINVYVNGIVCVISCATARTLVTG